MINLMNTKNHNSFQNSPLPKSMILEDKIKISYTDKFKNQVKYTCSVINEKEWSGVLFYTCKGDFPNLEIELQEIYVMDKGSAAYTEYEYDEDIVEFRMNNPHTLEYEIGHIHSHVNMGVFFSGTDTDELVSNVFNHLYYLSVIVNNKGQITGKIATVAETPVGNTLNIKTKEGKKLFKNLEESKLETVLISDCEIEPFKEVLQVDEDFVKRVEQINTKVVASSYHNPRLFYDGNSFNGYLNNTKNEINTHNNHYYQTDQFKEMQEDFDFESAENEDIPLSDFLTDEDMQEFWLYILTMGKYESRGVIWEADFNNSYFTRILSTYKFNEEYSIKEIKTFINAKQSNYWVEFVKYNGLDQEFNTKVVLDKETKKCLYEYFIEDLYPSIIDDEILKSEKELILTVTDLYYLLTKAIEKNGLRTSNKI